MLAPGLVTVVLKLSLNCDQAIRPQGRMSPWNGCPASILLSNSQASGLHTELALSWRASCLSFLLRTYLAEAAQQTHSGCRAARAQVHAALD